LGVILASGDTLIVGFNAVTFVATGTLTDTVRRAVSISPSAMGVKSIKLKVNMSFLALRATFNDGISEVQSHNEIIIAKKRAIESEFLNMVVGIVLVKSLQLYFRLLMFQKNVIQKI
jgi:hypothetical protein